MRDRPAPLRIVPAIAISENATLPSARAGSAAPPSATKSGAYMSPRTSPGLAAITTAIAAPAISV